MQDGSGDRCMDDDCVFETSGNAVSQQSHIQRSFNERSDLLASVDFAGL